MSPGLQLMHQLKREGVCVTVCVCAGLLGRSLAAANIQLCSVRRFVGLKILDIGWGQLLTIDNLEI